MPSQTTKEKCAHFKKVIENLKTKFAELYTLSNTDLKPEDTEFKNCVDTHHKYYELSTFIDDELPKLKTEIAEAGKTYVEIGGQRIEVGPVLEEMPWDEIPAKLAEINKTLKKGERPWRILTQEEFEDWGKPIADIWRDGALETEQKIKKAEQQAKSMGFVWIGDYWSSTPCVNELDNAWGWGSGYGVVFSKPKKHTALVLLVR